MSKLKAFKFSELYEMSSGISSKPEQAGHGFPFISFGTVFNNTFLPESLSELMNTTEKERKKYSVKEGDILLTRTSETVDDLAMSCVAVKDMPDVTFSGFVKRFRPKQTDISYHKFMAFYLRSNLFRKTMKNNAVMTLRASLNEQIFSYLNLLLPEYNEQMKIGDLLYLLNQKIEINKKINTELEAMVKLIHEYWFVQFDFPAPDNSSYKTAGGEMVFNRDLKRKIPIGWRSGSLNDISQLVRGVTYDKSDIGDKYKSGFVPLLRATNINGHKVDLEDMVYVPERLITEEQILNKYDVLITMSSGSKDHIGKNGLFYFDDKVSFGAFCAKLVAKHEFQYYLYAFTQSDFMNKTIRNECLGTNINNLNASLVNGFKLVLPPVEVIQEYNKKVDSAFKKIESNERENQKLSLLRDWLLPMLMNGQVTVKD